MKYYIEDIEFKRTGETRTDGRYPDRIGRTVEFLNDYHVGLPLYFHTIKNNKGEEVDGNVTRTSIVDDFDSFTHPGYLYIFTRNSIYIFKEIKEN